MIGTNDFQIRRPVPLSVLSETQERDASWNLAAYTDGVWLGDSIGSSVWEGVLQALRAWVSEVLFPLSRKEYIH